METAPILTNRRPLSGTGMAWFDLSVMTALIVTKEVLRGIYYYRHVRQKGPFQSPEEYLSEVQQLTPRRVLGGRNPQARRAPSYRPAKRERVRFRKSVA
jgi:hypothetical protein